MGCLLYVNVEEKNGEDGVEDVKAITAVPIIMTDAHPFNILDPIHQSSKTIWNKNWEDIQSYDLLSIL
eukprot:scaffold26670_cov137-Cylindrotheca_fusiformis.AAC.1